VDPERIVLLGHSEGGVIAPLVAADDPRIAAVVLVAGPSRRGREIIEYQRRWAVEHDSTVPPERRDSAVAAHRARADSTLGRLAWWRWFMEHDPLPVARRLRQPVLVLHGATDRQVTADQAQELAAAIRRSGNGDVTVRVFPGVNHLLLRDPVGDPARYDRLPSTRVVPEFLGALADWLAAKLR
jgi:dipeptidyl aminopeptidase/acylaminoacyl peptidase